MKYNLKYGFTLAEVLVTLGIIGVVASMTMPTLIANSKKSELESRFKKAHSMIAQAVTQMGQDNPDLRNMYCSPAGGYRDATENIFIRDFAKYFSVVRSEYGSTADLRTLGYKDRTFWQSGPGHEVYNVDGHDNGAILLSNGMMIASSGCWWKANGVGTDFMVDTNGPKGPNKLGQDVFYFQIAGMNDLLPDSGNYIFAPDETSLKNCCNFNANNTCSVPQDTGVSCAQYAMRDTNPNDSNKRYWESLP